VKSRQGTDPLADATPQRSAAYFLFMEIASNKNYAKIVAGNTHAYGFAANSADGHIAPLTWNS
jgi:hypothetical protein